MKSHWMLRQGKKYIEDNNEYKMVPDMVQETSFREFYWMTGCEFPAGFTKKSWLSGRENGILKKFWVTLKTMFAYVPHWFNSYSSNFILLKLSQNPPY